MKEPEVPSERTSSELFEAAQRGDLGAREDLCRKYLPWLTRWAHGRLPRWARSVLNTEDIVQETLMRTIQRVGDFERRRQGAFQAYLRQALRNRIHDAVRKAQKSPMVTSLGDLVKEQASPLEEVMGREKLRRFEASFSNLRPKDQQAIVARIELGLSYAEVAEALSKPSSEAARKAVKRAVTKLVEGMSDGS